MTEIKRYVDQYPVSYMAESDSGDWVDYYDHAAIVAALQGQVRELAAEIHFNKLIISRVSAAVSVGRTGHAMSILGELGETPATDAFIREIRAQSRAEGIHFAANRMLAAWESGFIDDTPASAYDISGAVLSAIEFLPNADEGEFKRDYADEVRARIRAGEKS